MDSTRGEGERIKRFKVGTELDDYDHFFQNSWAASVREQATGNALEQDVFDLCATWHGLSEARRLPNLMVRLLATGMRGFMRDQPIVPIKVLYALADRVLERPLLANIKVPRKARPALRREIRELAKSIETATDEELESQGGLFHEEQIWAQMFRESPLTAGLWQSEVNAYCGVYFAYENFFVRVAKRLSGRAKLQAKGAADVVELELGQASRRNCWDDSRVEKARLIRHALVHNGRRMTRDLNNSQFRSGIELQDGEIVILPHDTTNLYSVLTACTDSLLDAAIPRLASDQ